jgi:hypothetical protein
VNQGQKDLGYKILDLLVSSIKSKPEAMEFQVSLDNRPRPPGMSLSSAGREERYLAWVDKGVPQRESQPRYMANLDVGTIAHDYIRYLIKHHPDAEITDIEREVTLDIDVEPVDGPLNDDRIQVKGHIDGFLHFDGLKVLIDIKCVPLYSFNSLDPRNTETNPWAKARKWSAGNYVFDAVEAFQHDIFKTYYIGQVACYEEALAQEGEKWDATAFILYSRDTSHLAVGIFDPEDWDKIVDDCVASMKLVRETRDPLVFDPCHEAAVEAEPHKVCQYCGYQDYCFDIYTRVFRGRPRMQIKRIHGED